MLVKTIATLLVSASLFLPVSAGEATVASGAWEDGTEIHWLCQDQKIKLPIQINTPDGKVYSATLVCDPV